MWVFLNIFFFVLLRDAIFVSLSNCLTSVFAGFVVFAYLGYIAYETHQSIPDVVQAGLQENSKKN